MALYYRGLGGRAAVAARRSYSNRAAAAADPVPRPARPNVNDLQNPGRSSRLHEQGIPSTYPVAFYGSNHVLIRWKFEMVSGLDGLWLLRFVFILELNPLLKLASDVLLIVNCLSNKNNSKIICFKSSLHLFYEVIVWKGMSFLFVCCDFLRPLLVHLPRKEF